MCFDLRYIRLIWSKGHFPYDLILRLNRIKMTSASLFAVNFLYSSTISNSLHRQWSLYLFASVQKKLYNYVLISTDFIRMISHIRGVKLNANIYIYIFASMNVLSLVLNFHLLCQKKKNKSQFLTVICLYFENNDFLKLAFMVSNSFKQSLTVQY